MREENEGKLINGSSLLLYQLSLSTGYYFLARFTIPEEYTLFTLAFLDKESEDYQTWSADTMIQVRKLVTTLLDSECAI